MTRVRLAHPTHLPVYRKVEHYRRHPMEGPPLTLLSGGTGARALSETLIRYTHNTSHILPTFDDGGSSRVLRDHFRMPPPGDLRNRLMALSDMTMTGNPEVSLLFRTRLPTEGDPKGLDAELATFLSDQHPQMGRIEARYRRIIRRHLERFIRHKPDDFDLRGGNIGNFVIAGAYLSIGDLESVIFEFSALAAVRGEVLPVCRGGDYHLMARLADGSTLVGQSLITATDHAAIEALAIVERDGDDWTEVRPSINPLAERAIRRSALVAFSMGSFYTSLVSILLVDGMGQAIRRAQRPKVFVANLVRDPETPGMRVSQMLHQIVSSLRKSDPEPGGVSDYVHYALVSDHGEDESNNHLPIDLQQIRAMGVEPICLPLEHSPGVHDVETVAGVLLSLC